MGYSYSQETLKNIFSSDKEVKKNNHMERVNTYKLDTEVNIVKIN